MPPRNELRVIKGGKGGHTRPNTVPVLHIDQLRERASQLRLLLALSPDEKACVIADDLDEAIGVLGRLELSDDHDAPQRAAEYRVLIAEIDAEILAVLKGA